MTKQYIKKKFIETARYRLLVGTIIASISVIEVILDGFGVFAANEALLITQFSAGTGLLGIGLIKKENRVEEVIIEEGI